MMLSTYSDFAPILILSVIVLAFVIGRHVPRDNLKEIDNIFAVFGFLLGFFAMILNLTYTNKDMFMLGPVIAVSCLLYLRYRDVFKEAIHHYPLLQINFQYHEKIFSILWWILISAAVFTYYFSEIYTRHPLFFFLISGAVAILGIQIIIFNISNPINAPILICKILLLSLILRYSAYSISPYPVGSDPWVHIQYISYFLDYGRVDVPSYFSNYYLSYPIAHLHATCAALLGSISPHDAMFLLGVDLTFSTIVPFLIIRMLTGNDRIALIAMLLLNFSDAGIQWGVQIIAMSYGIAIYVLILYLALKILSNPNGKIKYSSLLFLFLFVIVWTHTISAFISLVSLLALTVGRILYDVFYARKSFSIETRSVQIMIIPIMFLLITMIYHWMDPAYPFFDRNIDALIKSLSMETEFLGAAVISEVRGQWEELLQSLGFCMYVFFGVIGALYCLSYKEQAKKYFPLVTLVVVLFSFVYIFPMFGIRNFIPDRWAAFAFISLTLFTGFGLLCSLSLLKTKKMIFCAVVIFFFIGSFFMITNAVTNHDSPLYGEKSSVKLIWTESEMEMYSHMLDVYDGQIIADEHTQQRPIGMYIRYTNSEPYTLLNGGIDKELLSNGLVVWKRDSLTRPMHVRSDNSRYVATVFLGDQFWQYLKNNYGCISDVHSARIYLPNNSDF